MKNKIKEIILEAESDSNPIDHHAELIKKFIDEDHHEFLEFIIAVLIKFAKSDHRYSDVEKEKDSIIFCEDPRKHNIGHKLIHESPNPKILESYQRINEDEYHEILIKNLVPFSHYDLEENKSLLLENNFQNLNSISWDKGCYVGQEITARMKYRALLKKKIYTFNIMSGFPKKDQKIKEKGIDVLLDDRDLSLGYKMKDLDLIGVRSTVIILA